MYRISDEKYSFKEYDVRDIDLIADTKILQIAQACNPDWRKIRTLRYFNLK